MQMMGSPSEIVAGKLYRSRRMHFSSRREIATPLAKIERLNDGKNGTTDLTNDLSADLNYSEFESSSSSSTPTTQSAHKFDADKYKTCVNIASLITVRGEGASRVVEQYRESGTLYDIDNSRRDVWDARIEHVDWYPDSFKLCSSSHVLNGYKRSASLVSNGQSILPYLQRSLGRAADMFRVGAYVHQYTDNGLEYADFLSSFRSLGQTVENYRSLSS